MRARARVQPERVRTAGAHIEQRATSGQLNRGGYEPITPPSPIPLSLLSTAHERLAALRKSGKMQCAAGSLASESVCGWAAPRLRQRGEWGARCRTRAVCPGPVAARSALISAQIFFVPRPRPRVIASCKKLHRHARTFDLAPMLENACHPQQRRRRPAHASHGRRCVHREALEGEAGLDGLPKAEHGAQLLDELRVGLL